VPGGTTSILGTTSVRISSPDNIRPQVTEIDAIIDEGAAMIPSLATTRYIRAYCGVRPLINLSDSCNDRCVSRGFVLLDHGEQGVSNMVTITGGKLTTYRLMAEKTADLVCAKIGVDAPCRTRTLILPDTAEGHWTKPGAAPRQWFSGPRVKEALLCECEMVPGSVIDAILGHLTAAGSPTSLEAIGLRSRLGKGPCQGAYCSLRVLAYLYDHHERSGADGLDDARSFIRERWKGLYPLLWDMPMVQAELQEALHCGFLNLEADAPPVGSGEP
jgi:glycerol-3-phosphate dehydrogenase